MRYFRYKPVQLWITGSLLFCLSGNIYAQSVQTQQASAVSHKMQYIDKTNTIKTNVSTDINIEVPAPRIPPTPSSASKNILQEPTNLTTSSSVVYITDITSVPKVGTSHSCNLNVGTNIAPSDIHGAVGKNKLVVVTNSDIAVYDRHTCSQVSAETLADFFADVDTSGHSLFDPRVVYDFDNDRFFVTVESYNKSNGDQNQYIAVSKDNTGSNWWMYRIVLSEGSNFWCKQASDSFWDYPSVGYDGTNWYITANDFGSTVVGAIISIDKSDTLTGANINFSCENNLTFNIAPSIVLDSADSVYFLSPGSWYGDSVIRYKFTPSGNNGNGIFEKTSSITVNRWEAASGAYQPNGEKLDTLGGRFQSASIQRGNYLWNVHTVKMDDNTSAVRYYKFSTTDTSAITELTFTSNESAPYLFNPSIAVSPSGKVFINTSYTTADRNASMMMIVGIDGSTSDWSMTIIAVSSDQFENCNSGCRWGDYSSAQLDPYNFESAWGFNQLANGNTMFQWRTVGAQIPPLSSPATMIPVYFLLQ